MFKVGITRDFLTADGKLVYKDMGLDILDNEKNISYEFLTTQQSPVIPEMITGYDAIISLAPAYNAESFKNIHTLKAICRFGVGYDMVDVDACSKANVLLTITKGAVDHSVAEAVITWMLTLSHKVLQKDQLVKTGKWGERSLFMGSELRGKTLGIIGLGGIGTKLAQMLAPFGMKKILAYDPYADAAKAKAAGVNMADLHTLLQASDFVSVNCPLTPETKNLIGEKELSLLQKHTYIINTARGGIINEEALVKALQQQNIAGYATDVFEKEPVDSNHPLLSLPNVIAAPHCIAWTDELFSEIGRMVCRQVVQLSKGQVPDHVINTQILHQQNNKISLP